MQIHDAAQEDFGGFWRRVLATLIDLLILWIPMAVAEAALLDWMYGPVTPTRRGTMLVQCVAMYGTWAIYEIPFYVSPWQATPGKRLCGLAVTNLNGQRLTIAHAIGRYLAKIVSGAIVIGIFFIAGTRRRQALHDLMARTLVPRRDTLARLQRT